MTLSGDAVKNFEKRKKHRRKEEHDSDGKTDQEEDPMDDKTMLIQNWRQALRTPHMYRVGSSTMHIQNKLLVGVILLLLATIVFIYISPTISNDLCKPVTSSCPPRIGYDYNRTYPLTTPQNLAIGFSYKIAIISDMDEASKSTTKENVWNSYLKKGTLTWMPKNKVITVTWEDDMVTVSSSLALKGRSMELSELVVFDGRLLSFDDRTGIIYYFENDVAYPWIFLPDGNGKNVKGFKSEWATVKDEYLYVGSAGKEWTTTNGVYINDNPMWVKKVSPTGEIQSLNWIDNYKKIRKAYKDIEFPGYMIHESAMWSAVHKLWFFLPRRCSENTYDDNTDELMSCNVMITADEDFTDIKAKEIGTLTKIRGFSSFKFLPGSNDSIIVALKTEEFQGQTATYVTAFSIDGTILMPELKVIDKKFEGLEFV